MSAERNKVTLAHGGSVPEGNEERIAAYFARRDAGRAVGRVLLGVCFAAGMLALGLIASRCI